MRTHGRRPSAGRGPPGDVFIVMTVVAIDLDAVPGRSAESGPHPQRHTGVQTYMPRGRIKGDHDSKRVQIAEAACRVFLRLGLARSSLADIAREMGYTTGVLRHYFTDRDELLLYSKNLLFDRSHERARAAAAAEGLESLHAMTIELLPVSGAALDGYRLLAMFNGNAIGDPRLMELQHERNHSHALLFAKVIVSLQRQGILPKKLNARIEASGILALVDGLAEQLIMKPGAWPKSALIAHVRRHIDNLARAD